MQAYEDLEITEKRIDELIKAIEKGMLNLDKNEEICLKNINECFKDVHGNLEKKGAFLHVTAKKIVGNKQFITENQLKEIAPYSKELEEV